VGVDQSFDFADPLNQSRRIQFVEAPPSLPEVIESAATTTKRDEAV
jgi:hypothetical protein